MIFTLQATYLCCDCEKWFQNINLKVYSWTKWSTDTQLNILLKILLDKWHIARLNYPCRRQLHLLWDRKCNECIYCSKLNCDQWHDWWTINVFLEKVTIVTVKMIREAKRNVEAHLVYKTHLGTQFNKSSCGTWPTLAISTSFRSCSLDLIFIIVWVVM